MYANVTHLSCEVWYVHWPVDGTVVCEPIIVVVRSLSTSPLIIPHPRSNCEAEKQCFVMQTQQQCLFVHQHPWPANTQIVWAVHKYMYVCRIHYIQGPTWLLRGGSGTCPCSQPLKWRPQQGRRESRCRETPPEITREYTVQCVTIILKWFNFAHSTFLNCFSRCSLCPKQITLPLKQTLFTCMHRVGMVTAGRLW